MAEIMIMANINMGLKYLTSGLFAAPAGDE
jgi:hypothetical protein